MVKLTENLTENMNTSASAETIWEPLPVHGYTKQRGDIVALVNVNKTYEEKVLRLLDDIAEIDGVDMRWLAIGKTHIEQGWMAVNRAIFKPQRIKLDDDPNDPNQ